MPELEFQRVARRPLRAPAPKKATEDLPLELAIDPRILIDSRSAPEAQGIRADPYPSVRPSAADVPRSHARAPTPAAASAEPMDDVACDARLLADYGRPPSHWLLSPFYAWRVLRRRRDLKAALKGRREEATRTAREVEDALVAFAERVRTSAHGQEAIDGDALAKLTRAEELLRSRHGVLATEQDAQTSRLAQAEVQQAKLEQELDRVRGEEQALVGELAEAQRALARAEASLRRAELELRAARQRDKAASRDGSDA